MVPSFAQVKKSYFSVTESLKSRASETTLRVYEETTK